MNMSINFQTPNLNQVPEKVLRLSLKIQKTKVNDPSIAKEVKVNVKRRSRIKQEVVEKADKRKLKNP